jgi:plastocyanin
LRYRVAVLIGVVGLVSAAACDLSLVNEDVEHEVTVEDGRFMPDTLRAARGSLVTWHFEGSTAHSSVGPYWNSGTRQPGQSWSLRLNNAGPATYRCTQHPTEVGVLIVE